QNRGSSLSDKTRSLLLVALRSTLVQGLTLMISSRSAQEKIAEAAARVWLAVTGAVIERINALTSDRLIVLAGNLPQRWIKCLSTRAAACFQDRLCFMANCSRYSLASFSKLPCERCAFFSACGSSP